LCREISDYSLYYFFVMLVSLDEDIIEDQDGVIKECVSVRKCLNIACRIVLKNLHIRLKQLKCRSLCEWALCVSSVHFVKRNFVTGTLNYNRLN